MARRAAFSGRSNWKKALEATRQNAEGEIALNDAAKQIVAEFEKPRGFSVQRLGQLVRGRWEDYVELQTSIRGLPAPASVWQQNVVVQHLPGFADFIVRHTPGRAENGKISYEWLRQMIDSFVDSLSRFLFDEDGKPCGVKFLVTQDPVMNTVTANGEFKRRSWYDVLQDTVSTCKDWNYHKASVSELDCFFFGPELRLVLEPILQKAATSPYLRDGLLQLALAIDLCYVNCVRGGALAYSNPKNRENGKYLKTSDITLYRPEPGAISVRVVYRALKGQNNEADEGIDLKFLNMPVKAAENLIHDTGLLFGLLFMLRGWLPDVQNVHDLLHGTGAQIAINDKYDGECPVFMTHAPGGRLLKGFGEKIPSPISNDKQTRAFATRVVEAGMPRSGLHAIRRGAGDLLRALRGPADASNILGHRDEQTMGSKHYSLGTMGFDTVSDILGESIKALQHREELVERYKRISFFGHAAVAVAARENANSAAAEDLDSDDNRVVPLPVVATGRGGKRKQAGSLTAEDEEKIMAADSYWLALIKTRDDAQKALNQATLVDEPIHTLSSVKKKNAALGDASEPGYDERKRLYDVYATATTAANKYRKATLRQKNDEAKAAANKKVPNIVNARRAGLLDTSIDQQKQASKAVITGSSKLVAQAVELATLVEEASSSGNLVPIRARQAADTTLKQRKSKGKAVDNQQAKGDAESDSLDDELDVDLTEITEALPAFDAAVDNSVELPEDQSEEDKCPIAMARYAFALLVMGEESVLNAQAPKKAKKRERQAAAVLPGLYKSNSLISTSDEEFGEGRQTETLQSRNSELSETQEKSPSKRPRFGNPRSPNDIALRARRSAAVEYTEATESEDSDTDMDMYDPHTIE